MKFLSSIIFLLISSGLLFLVLNFIAKKSKDNLGHSFLLISTLKTVLFYFFIEIYVINDEKILQQNKVYLSLIFLISLLLDVFGASKLLKK